VTRIRLYRTDAIVLKRRDFGEADRIVTLYTPGRGKIAAIAKGVRRIASRKSGHVELFHHARLLLAQGRNLDVITQAESLETYRPLREDLIRATYAYHVAELVDRLTVEEVASPATFELLRDALRALSDAHDPSLVARYFEIHLLALLGYRPQLFACANCGAELQPEENFFGPEAGGVLCPACGGRRGDALRLPEVTLRVMRFLQSRDWSAARRLEVSSGTRGSLERTMHAYIRHVLERELRSVDFLQGLRRVSGSLDLAPENDEPPARRRQTAD
jgi:DNA repair protein RecO (recombination protein O)